MTEMHQTLSSAKNAPPKNIFEALRRIRACNKQQLAAALGVSRHTLTRWEQLAELGEPLSKTAAQSCSALLIATLRAADHADVMAQWSIDWDAIATIGGRR